MLRGRHQSEQQMQDTLQIGTPSGGDGFGNSPGPTTWTYASASPLKCRVETGTPFEVNDGTQTTILDTRIMVPLESSISATQRVKVTHRFRVALGTPKIYAVIGTPENGRSSMALIVKLVTGNSKL